MVERQKGYYVKQSFSNDFVNLLEDLYRKYGEDVFEIQGIANRHMDLAEFSREFFGKSSNAVADVSVDGNANVREKNVTQYTFENNKSIMKLNSLYMMYKKIKKIFSEHDATLALEKVVNGEIFINDLHTYAYLPYSYFQETPIYVRINKKEKYITMKKLFDYYKEFVFIDPDKEIIDLENVYKEIDYGKNIPVEKTNGNLSQSFKYYKYNRDTFSEKIKEYHNIEVLDSGGKWVKLKKVLRHKRHNNFIAYQIEDGNFAIVTEDHPIILEDDSEILARDLKKGDYVKSSSPINTNEYIDIPEEIAYLLGFITGDGNISKSEVAGKSKNLTNENLYIELNENKNDFIIYQNNWKERKIYDICKKVFSNYKFKESYKNKLSFSSQRLKMIMINYFNIEWENNSFTKTAPSNIMNWFRKSKEAYLSGLIDAKGSVKENGHCDIRMTSYSLINQLYDVVSSLNVKCNNRICGKSFSNLYTISFNVPKTMIGKFEKSKNIDLEKHENYKSQMVSKKRSNKVEKISVLNDDELPLSFSKENVWEWVYDITTETGTFYANGMTQHNCYAFDLRHLITNGMDFFHGNMKIGAPKRSDSFIALLIQTTAYISNQIAGAASYPDFFVILDWYYRKEYGENYMDRLRSQKNNSNHEEKHLFDLSVWNKIKNQFQNLIYSLNFPFRGGQSAFTNLSVMDHGFMNNLFDGYVLPDFTTPHIESTIELSKIFFEYYTDINSKEGIFTFPVMTIAIAVDGNNEYIDTDFVDWAAEINSKKSLANIFQDKATSFSSCCRLKNDFSKVADAGYQNSFGVAGLAIGSHRVAGLNLPRIALLENDHPDILNENLNLIHKILYAHREILRDKIDNGYLPLYTHNWIDLKKQYSTVGFVGGYEYVKNKGLDINQKNGITALQDILKKMEDKIVEWQENEISEKNIYNIEQIPAESMAVRLADLDYIQGFNNDINAERVWELYSNQYIPLIEEASIYDRIRIQGEFDSLTSGGAILHLNVDDEKPIDKNQFKKLMNTARELKTVYFAVNYAYSESSQGVFSIGKHDVCPINGDPIVQQYTRVVGFITPVSNWNKKRRDFEYPRRVFYRNGQLEITKQVEFV